MYNDAEHSEVVEKSPREELFNHKNKDWWSQGELCYTNEKNICAERFSDVSYVMSQEDLFWCLHGNLWHKWWGAVGLRCESSLLLRFHASLLDAKWEEQKWSPFLPTRMLVWHAEIKKSWRSREENKGFLRAKASWWWDGNHYMKNAAHILWVTKNPLICWNISAKYQIIHLHLPSKASGKKVVVL